MSQIILLWNFPVLAFTPISSSSSQRLLSWSLLTGPASLGPWGWPQSSCLGPERGFREGPGTDLPSLGLPERYELLTTFFLLSVVVRTNQTNGLFQSCQSLWKIRNCYKFQTALRNYECVLNNYEFEHEFVCTHMNIHTESTHNTLRSGDLMWRRQVMWITRKCMSLCSDSLAWDWYRYASWNICMWAVSRVLIKFSGANISTLPAVHSWIQASCASRGENHYVHVQWVNQNGFAVLRDHANL